MASKRVIREALYRALESYEVELRELDQRRKELKEKIAELGKEVNPNGQGTNLKLFGHKGRRGKSLPYGPTDIKSLIDKVSALPLKDKSAVDAAKLIYQYIGKDIHAGLVYNVLSHYGITIKAKQRAPDIFASYLRRNKDFEKVSPGTFKLKGA